MKRAPIVTTLLLATVLLLTAAAAVAGNRPIVRVTQGPPVPDQYVVVFSDQIATLGNGTAANAAEALARAFNASYGETWDHAIKGAVFRMNEQKAEAMARHPLVDYVAEDGMASVAVNQFNPPSWGLDRIDQVALPLNLTYVYGTTGSAVTVYVIDTGIRTTHNDFGGRASWGADFIDGTFQDCHGHGTHVAGTAGGTSFGVAKGVSLVAVRVLDCSGSGTFSQVISGVNWVTANATMPAVANQSLIGSLYPALNTAVTNSVAAGVFYAVAAGNYNANACNYSPASTPTAYTVGATDSSDNRAPYSNWGTCLDIFAPGSQITSAWNTSDTATNILNGTSMATPHVAGAAALVLGQNPAWTPAQVSSYLTSTATPGVVVNPGTGSPNLLLNTILPSPLGRTDELFPKLDYDHRYVHSGTHLQGVRADEKWAGGLIHQPPQSTGFDNMTAAVVVDNPDLSQSMTVDVQFYDSLGNAAGPPTNLFIPPEGFQAVAATPLGATPYGMGTARVTVLEGPPLVGVTLQHAYTIMGISDPDQPGPPGASSMQQLQVVQDNATRLRWGPMPISLVDPQDFLNFNAPWFHVVNPNNAPNVIQVDVSYYDRVATTLVGPVTWRVVVLPPHGTLTEISGPHLNALMGGPATGLFNQLIQFYFSIPGIDWDVWVDVVSLNGLPILGDGYLLDAVGLSDDQPRFRMASTMMASDVAGVLESPELSYQPGGIIQTLFGVTNVGAATGPLVIQYYNKNGALLSTGNVASLPAGQSLRIYPGTFNYPTGIVDFGWLRIIGSVSDDQLVGWTVREILEDPEVDPQYHKAYGETLLHLNGAEPGPGWPINSPTPMIRKVIPFTRVQDTSFEWPGYSTFVNSWGPNVNNYRWELWDGMGTFCGNLYFPGVPYAHTSWTYEDILNVLCWWGPLNVSGRVDHEKERIEGIDVIGDPLWEYGIPGFAGW